MGICISHTLDCVLSDKLTVPYIVRGGDLMQLDELSQGQL